MSKSSLLPGIFQPLFSALYWEVFKGNTINWKILKEMEYQTTWPASWETYMLVRKKQLELDMEQQTGSK